jgi:hypothetical protein
MDLTQEQWNTIKKFIPPDPIRKDRRGRGAEFLEARIIPQRIEHRIEPEQCGSERDVFNQRGKVRYRE